MEAEVGRSIAVHRTWDESHMKLVTDLSLTHDEVRELLASGNWSPVDWPVKNPAYESILRTERDRYLAVAKDSRGGVLFRDAVGALSHAVHDPRYPVLPMVHPVLDQAAIRALLQSLRDDGLVRDQNALGLSDLELLDKRVMKLLLSVGAERTYEREAHRVAALIGEYLRMRSGGRWVLRPCAYDLTINESWIEIGDSEHVSLCALADLVLRGVDEDYPVTACVVGVLAELR